MTAPLAQAETLTGARVRVFDGSAWPELNEKVGGGYMLMIDMTQSGDGRHAEVFLDKDAAAEVVRGLTDT